MFFLSQLYRCQFFFSCYGGHRDLHSFPTRRSSDLGSRLGRGADPEEPAVVPDPRRLQCSRQPRSEEHTSELQSRRDLVCRLLLEKTNAASHSAAATERKNTSLIAS